MTHTLFKILVRAEMRNGGGVDVCGDIIVTCTIRAIGSLYAVLHRCHTKTKWIDICQSSNRCVAECETFDTLRTFSEIYFSAHRSLRLGEEARHSLLDCP